MTNMNGLTNIVQVLGTHPAAKWLALALALRALWTIVAWRICPLVRGRVAADAQTAAQAQVTGQRQRMRFLAVMVLGIVMAVVCLFRMAEAGDAAPLALLGLTTGIYLFTTEPVRRMLGEAQNRVMTAGAATTDAQAMSMAMLRDAHVKLVAVEVGILLLIILGMSMG
jgi:hypothetical protein